MLLKILEKKEAIMLPGPWRPNRDSTESLFLQRFAFTVPKSISFSPIIMSAFNPLMSENEHFKKDKNGKGYF